jgi:hypothetical protein
MTEPQIKELSADEIESIRKTVIEVADDDKEDEAWGLLQPLITARKQIDSAICLLKVVDGRHFSVEHALEVLRLLYEDHSSDEWMSSLIGDSLDSARNIDELNLAAPEHPLFAQVVVGLSRLAEKAESEEDEDRILRGLATAARMMARQRDHIADAAAKRRVELDPKDSTRHYNYGLLLKTRGRFREGMIANQTAEKLETKTSEACAWNLGICATGAGEGTVALKVWKDLGNKIEMGRFGLPEGRYPQCKVKLAERPLAERSAENDDPGLEETIWVERLSPCHGVIRSVLYQDLGVDYGDVVLFDGAPITYHTYGEKKVPVFPHLATLLRQKYQFFDFAATQDAPNRISDVSNDLARDAIVYSHTENYQVLCATCWNNQDSDHETHEREEKHVVIGRIAAPSDMAPADLLAQIDKSIGTREPCRIFCPALCEAAGQKDRAKIERRRFEMLTS